LVENLGQDGLALGYIDAIRTARAEKGGANVHFGFDGLRLRRAPGKEAVVVGISKVGWVLRGALDPAVANKYAFDVPLGVGCGFLVAI
jgi:hypothetical protein